MLEVAWLLKKSVERGITLNKEIFFKRSCEGQYRGGVYPQTHLVHLLITFDGQIDLVSFTEPLGGLVPLQCKIDICLKGSWGLGLKRFLNRVVKQSDFGSTICRCTPSTRGLSKHTHYYTTSSLH